jgi:Ca2+-binding EF-hand superfamily protein
VQASALTFSSFQWVSPAKKLKIKEKLQSKFSSPQECFKDLDCDGGGSLDRSEIAKGLRSVGIWLHPSELFALLEFLDEDGSGSVELDEMETFWNSVETLPDENLDDVQQYLQGSL